MRCQTQGEARQPQPALQRRCTQLHATCGVTAANKQQPASAARTPAQVRFCRILARVVAPSASASSTWPRRSPSSTTPAASPATAVPPPMAMPTLALASAGASLTPSPTCGAEGTGWRRTPHYGQTCCCALASQHSSECAGCWQGLASRTTLAHTMATCCPSARRRCTSAALSSGRTPA